ncbi:PqqD family peptide modification chaperone [Streptococcus parasanguinis]|uniref:PqqD family peptide modification chaperone n=2 Tax=Streptococcus parasanguinis TaxID=1318 RepID=UPI001F45FCBA|nr:PqqD family peptide modification chaperone [Streptococcus parasanguinis]
MQFLLQLKERRNRMTSIEEHKVVETELTKTDVSIPSSSKKYYYCKHLAWQMEPTTEVVYILDKKVNKMFLLEDSSKDIWLSFSKDRTYKQVLQNISEIYNCNITEIKYLVDNFVLELLDNGLIYEL